MFIGTNVYGWTQIAQREGRDFDRRAAMKASKAAGLTGWEDALRSADQAAEVAEQAEDEGMELRSAYVFGGFHTEDAAREATENALSICDTLMPRGVTRYITNPNPLPDGALKSDAELRFQARAVETLGRSLADRGAELLYHTHDPEMRAAAREFHHMMASTDPEALKLCLDVHWIWRGAGNSMVALEDIVRLYGTRVSEVHLRQSTDGIWSETVGAGDIDLEVIADMLAARDVRALLVLEHAYEDGTPNSIDPVEAHRASREYVEQVFGKVAA